MYYRVKLDIRILPEPVKEVLEGLKKTKGLVVRGGVARLSLLETLIKQGKNINPLRLKIEREVKDFDVIFIHYDTLPKSRDFLLQKERETREKIGKTTLLFRGQDIEPVKGVADKDGKLTEDTIDRILDSRDLTINEVILVSEGNEWQIYYTKRCWRDIICGIGMLNGKDIRTTRRDLGRIVPSNRGFYRLFKFLAEGKVEEIWLPKWQKIAHLMEMARRQANGELPLGVNLGRYSLVIANIYKDADIQTKRRWMQVLQKLGFTDLGDWDTFAKEQSLLDQLRNGDFEFESELPFAEIIDRLIVERAQRQEAKHQRSAGRKECTHQFENFGCDGCQLRCLIQKCQKCTQFQFIGLEVPELPCNEVFIAGDWKVDERSLLGFPGRF